jgi:pyruvate, water dikinase
VEFAKNKDFIHFSTGLPGLDSVLQRLIPGDNIVLRVDSIDDYLPFVTPFEQFTGTHHQKLIYFRFAQHKALLPSDSHAEAYHLHPEEGFEAFIAEIFDVIEKFGPGACYIFDCLSELAVDWYSDRMLGNFFMLTCPYLYEYETITYFGLLRNYHSSFANDSIHNTAQVVLDVFRNKNKLYLHPLKVYDRYTPTMYMLHSWEDDRFLPVTRSATVTEILAKVPQPWLDFSIQRMGLWQRTFLQAEESLDSVRSGRMPALELDYVFQRLARMAITRDEGLLKLVTKYLDLSDIIAIRKRMIGTGLIGGKSVGMLLARAILKKTGDGWDDKMEAHDSFFIGSDVFYSYLVANDCWWVRRKQRSHETLLDGSENARQRLLSGSFPDYIRSQFMEMLDYFGQSPIIVRSSSLLEDNYGNAFSGKYESVFCANQGSPRERLETFISAVRKVYASTMSREALVYRDRRNLLDRDEQMALLVQRVSGTVYDDLFFPQAAGVGFSFNPFVWNSEIDPKAGMLRLVFGLGTRAVDRCDDDYTRVVALNAPQKRPEGHLDELRKFSQRRVDVLDLRANQLVSRYFEDVVKSVPGLPLDLFASQDQEMERRARDQGAQPVFSWVLTFDRLFEETSFIPDMREMLRALQEAYGSPVDIEFTVNFLDDREHRINLVQCRPLQVQRLTASDSVPKVGETADIVLKTNGPIIGNSVSISIDRLIYVVPSVYGKLAQSERYSIARLIGRLTHAQRDGHPPEHIMLVGPGRFGTTTPSLGVPVSFAEINTVSVVCELATMHEGLVPDISLGTHFFNDLVETNMLYLALYPDREGYSMNEPSLRQFPNRLLDLVPEASAWAEAIRVVDLPDPVFPRTLFLNADVMNQRAVCFVGEGDQPQA